jgi:hypothetical protein
MSTNINSTTNSQYVSSNMFKNALVGLNSIKSVFPLNLSRANTNYLFAFLDSHVIHYPTPITLTYAWSFGSLAGICLVIQMISGIFLAMHYTPNIELAFNSVEYIMRDVPNGWLIRYIHANGASMCAGKTCCKVFYLRHIDLHYYLVISLEACYGDSRSCLDIKKYHQFSFTRTTSGGMKRLNIVIKISANCS